MNCMLPQAPIVVVALALALLLTFCALAVSGCFLVCLHCLLVYIFAPPSTCLFCICHLSFVSGMRCRTKESISIKLNTVEDRATPAPCGNNN